MQLVNEHQQECEDTYYENEHSEQHQEENDVSTYYDNEQYVDHDQQEQCYENEHAD